MATLSVVIMCMVVLYPLASVSWLSHQWRPWAVISCTASSFIWFPLTHFYPRSLSSPRPLPHPNPWVCSGWTHTDTTHTHSPLLSRSGTFPTVTIAPQLHLFFAFIVGCESGVQVSSSPDGCSHAWRWPEAVHTSCGCPPQWSSVENKSTEAPVCPLRESKQTVIHCLSVSAAQARKVGNKKQQRKRKKSRRAMTSAHCSSLTGLYMMLSCFTL